MKLYDIHGKLVNVDVRPSSYPIKQISKSKLQKEVGDFLQEKFPHSSILEEFTIPGSRFKIDFFIVDKKLIIEVDGEQHYKNGFFHGQILEKGFARQVKRDIIKEEWAEINGLKTIRIKNKEDLCQMNL